MKKEFEDFFSELNKEEITESWNLAKKESKKRNRLAIIVILIFDIVIVYFGSGVIKNSPFGMFNNMPGTMNSLGNGIFRCFFIMPIFMMFLFIDMFIFLLFRLFFNKNNKKYNQDFKEKIVDLLIKNFFTEVDYVPNKKIPREMYDMAEYKEYYNRYYSDDYIDAKINDKYSLKMGEVTTQEVRHHRDSKGRSHTTTITKFSGLFIRVDLGMSIENNLKIARNNAIYSKDKLEMDSNEFEEYFDVSSSNRIKGMELLTPDVMELLLSFRKVLNENFDIYINNNVMYIRLHVGCMFESKVDKKTSIDKEIVKKYYNILDFTYNISNIMTKLIEEYNR